MLYINNFYYYLHLFLFFLTCNQLGTLISVGYDYVKPSQYPGVWNLKKVFLMSSVLAGVALLSSLIILFLCLNSWDENSLLRHFGLQNLSYGQITTVVYLKVSVSDFLTLFSARTHSGFFWSSKPSPILLIASIFALSLSTLIACAWPDSQPDGIYALGLGYKNPKSLALFVWLYCLIWWFVQDLCKVLLYKFMEKNNTFGINDSSGSRRNKNKKNNNNKNSKNMNDCQNQHSTSEVTLIINDIEQNSEGRNPLFAKFDENDDREMNHNINNGTLESKSDGNEAHNELLLVVKGEKKKSNFLL